MSKDSRVPSFPKTYYSIILQVLEGIQTDLIVTSDYLREWDPKPSSWGSFLKEKCSKKDLEGNCECECKHIYYNTLTLKLSSLIIYYLKAKMPSFTDFITETKTRKDIVWTYCKHDWNPLPFKIDGFCCLSWILHPRIVLWGSACVI